MDYGGRSGDALGHLLVEPISAPRTQKLQAATPAVSFQSFCSGVAACAAACKTATRTGFLCNALSWRGVVRPAVRAAA